MSRDKDEDDDLTEEEKEMIRMMMLKPHAYKLHLERQKELEDAKREIAQAKEKSKLN